MRDVCGGINRNYARVHGSDELSPYGEQADDPYFFQSDMQADIVVPAYAPSETLSRLLLDIPRVTAPPYRLVVVGKHQSASLNRNDGLGKSGSRYVIMCDDDIADLPFGWNRRLVQILRENRDLAAVSARLLRADGRPGGNVAHDETLVPDLVRVDHIPTACCAFRRTEVRFDEGYVRAGWEDTDYFMQLRSAHGGDVAIANDVRVLHLNEEKNGGGAGNRENALRFLHKWGAAYPVPPAGSPQLGRAEALLACGDAAGALRVLRSLLEAGARDMATCAHAGIACWLLGARKEGLELLRHALQSEPAVDDPAAKLTALAERFHANEAIPALLGAPQPARALLGRGTPTSAAAEGDRRPLVSVVIPCYRQAEYLPFAVASVVTQTFTDWEIVIVDDGSPDDTGRVAQQLTRHFNGHAIRLVRQANAGVAAARNAGIRASRGHLILPLDADDALDPTFLAKTVAALHGDARASVAFTDVARFGEAEGVDRMGPWSSSELARRNVAVCTSLYERAVWEAAGGYDETMLEGYEDWDFWLTCVERRVEAVHVREPLFFYRYAPGSRVLRAAERDAEFRAALVLKHPALHTPDDVQRATALLARDGRTGRCVPVAHARAGMTCDGVP